MRLPMQENIPQAYEDDGSKGTRDIDRPCTP